MPSARKGNNALLVFAVLSLALLVPLASAAVLVETEDSNSLRVQLSFQGFRPHARLNPKGKYSRVPHANH